MLVGDKFYGDKTKFQKGVATEGENELQKYKTMITSTQDSDPNAEAKSWDC